MTAQPEPQTFDDFDDFDEALEVLEGTNLAKSAKAKAREVVAHVHVTASTAPDREITTDEEADLASAFLVEVARIRKANEAERKEITGPLLAAKAAIDAKYKQTDAPFATFDRRARQLLGEWQAKKEAARLAEQQRRELEAAEANRIAREEREAAERQAREAREQAEAAARAAAERQAAAERARQEQLRAHADTLAGRAAQTPTDRLREVIANEATADDVRDACRTELAAREERARAAEEAEAAAKAAAEARAAEEAAAAAQPAPVVVAQAAEVVRQTRANGGSVGTRKRWVGEVVDESLVPREFLRIHMPSINEAIREGAREIPGVRIEQVADVAVRT